MNEEAVILWIRRAESDLKIGRDELVTEDPATDAICFHMQQCAEKYPEGVSYLSRKRNPTNPRYP